MTEQLTSTATASGSARRTAVEASFIVIAFNESEHIERTLRSISGQEGLEDYEIIVVDDASSDATADLAELYGRIDPAVKVVRLEENRGRGHARWVGVGQASGLRIATVDSDIVLPPDWYSRCLQELQQADAVGGIAVPDGDATYLFSTFSLEPRIVRHTAELTGNNALYRSDVFRAVHFDPELRNGEDVALGKAMREHAISTRTIDDLLVRHEESKSLGASFAWLFESGVGASRQLRRYRELRQPDVVFAAWLATACFAASRPSGRRLRAAAASLGFVAAAAAGHVNSRFDLRQSRARDAAGAVAVDSGLLLAYFAGRLLGFFR
jgi:glycosyltransferase involved in cell wall biosynthesis